MKGVHVALIVVGLVAVGGAVFVFTRKPGPLTGPLASSRPSQSVAGSLISQIGGRALSQGINFLGSKLEDSLDSLWG